MKERNSESSANKIIFIFAAALLVLFSINTLLVLNTYKHLAEAGNNQEAEMELDYKQAVAMDILEYSRQFARDLGVLEKSSVKERLANFNYEVETSSEGEDLTQIILTEGRRLQEIILREWEIELQENVLAVINRDENVKETGRTTHLGLVIDRDNIEVSPGNLLQDSTVSRIQEIYQSSNPGRSHEIDIEIREGEGYLISPDDPMEQIKALNEEIDDLRLTLRELRVEAGMAEMRGEGVVVELSDREGAVTSDAIIHDTDVRDLVNELYASGAQGVAVGDQRLTATSSIRCAGNLIKVNGNIIPVPVEIKAVGDPELLTSGLQIIKNNLEVQRNLGFNIETREEITLPPY